MRAVFSSPPLRPINPCTHFVIRQQRLSGIQVTGEFLLREVVMQIPVTVPAQHQAATHLLTGEAFLEPLIRMHCAWDQVVEGQAALPAAQLARTDAGFVVHMMLILLDCSGRVTAEASLTDGTS
jgi:hypothetical protein